MKRGQNDLWDDAGESQKMLSRGYPKTIDGEKLLWSASLAWVVEFDPDAIKDLTKLDKQVQVRIIDFLRKCLGALANPRELGEPLAGSKLGNYWKYRVGDWRVICDLQDERIVVRILRVGNRREVYR